MLQYPIISSLPIKYNHSTSCAKQHTTITPTSPTHRAIEPSIISHITDSPNTNTKPNTSHLTPMPESAQIRPQLPLY